MYDHVWTECSTIVQEKMQKVDFKDLEKLYVVVYLKFESDIKNL